MSLQTLEGLHCYYFDKSAFTASMQVFFLFFYFFWLFVSFACFSEWREEVSTLSSRRWLHWGIVLGMFPIPCFLNLWNARKLFPNISILVARCCLLIFLSFHIFSLFFPQIFFPVCVQSGIFFFSEDNEIVSDFSNGIDLLHEIKKAIACLWQNAYWFKRFFFSSSFMYSFDPKLALLILAPNVFFLFVVV